MIVKHQRFAAGAFPRRLRAWRERNNLSQSEAALKLQISKRSEHCKSGSKIELRHAALREPQSKKPFAPSAPTGGCWRKSLLYVNHV